MDLPFTHLSSKASRVALEFATGRATAAWIQPFTMGRNDRSPAVINQVIDSKVKHIKPSQKNTK
ncbi:hypothetical protein HNR03_002720 [Pseudomonas sp. JAI111]|nr:hypothetical protein [Pseudomonas sp. JAI111]